MAIGTPVVVGTATATATSTTIVVTLSSGVAIGDRVFVLAGGRASAAPPVSAVDAAGNTYALDKTAIQADGNNNVGLLSAPVTATLNTSDTVTVTFSGTVGPSIEAIVFSCSGLAASALDKTSSAFFDLSTSPNFNGGTTASTTSANELVVGGFVFGSASVGLTAGSGYTSLLYLSSAGAGSGDRPIWVEYRVVSSAGVQSASGVDNSAGNVAGVTATYKASGGDVTPPTVPTGLAVTGSLTPTGGGLSWTASTDAVGVTGYNVYRGGVLFRTVTGTTALITNLASNTTYSFTVSAFDLAGNESAQSSSVSVTTYKARRRATTIDPRPLAGAYRGPGTNGMNDMREWERWLGRPVKRALDFMPTDNWGSIENPFNGYWNSRLSPFAANGGERLTVGLTLLPDSNTGGATNPGTDPPTLAQAATGIYAPHYSKVADFLSAHNLFNVTLRPGNEHNGNWGLPWQPATGGGTRADFAAAYQSCVTTMRARAVTLGFAQTWKFEYSWATGDSGGGLEMDGVNYPGDSYWDVLSLNCYDESYSGEDVDQRWASLLTTNPTIVGPGLNYARDFVASKGKVLAFGELGVVWHPSATNYAAPDTPRFLEYAFDWISDADNRVSYWNWWDGSSTWVYKMLQRDPTSAVSKVLPLYQRTYHRFVSARALGAAISSTNRPRVYER